MKLHFLFSHLSSLFVWWLAPSPDLILPLFDSTESAVLKCALWHDLQPWITDSLNPWTRSNRFTFFFFSLTRRLLPRRYVYPSDIKVKYTYVPFFDSHSPVPCRSLVYAIPGRCIKRNCLDSAPANRGHLNFWCLRINTVSQEHLHPFINFEPIAGRRKRFYEWSSWIFIGSAKIGSRSEPITGVAREWLMSSRIKGSLGTTRSSFAAVVDYCCAALPQLKLSAEHEQLIVITCTPP